MLLRVCAMRMTGCGCEACGCSSAGSGRAQGSGRSSAGNWRAPQGSAGSSRGVAAVRRSTAPPRTTHATPARGSQFSFSDSSSEHKSITSHSSTRLKGSPVSASGAVSHSESTNTMSFSFLLSASLLRLSMYDCMLSIDMRSTDTLIGLHFNSRSCPVRSSMSLCL